MSLVHASTVIRTLPFFKNEIIIKDWTGRELFKGPYTSPEVDKVLDANRCDCKDVESCKSCDGTGYSGDFEVHWLNENDSRNVYEHINY